MKKQPSAYYHRILLLSTLLAGATLLIFNAWMISSQDTDLLLIPWWPE